MSRVIGLDVGDKKIGVALSDPSQVLATPLKTIIRENDKKAVSEILQLTEKYGTSTVVIGLPYSLDGSIGKQAEKVLSFSRQIARVIKAEIVMQDERLTSVSAGQKLREAGKKRSKLKNEIDAAAATIILQSYLDETNSNSEIIS